MSICDCFSLGIDDPITKTAAGSERVYYQQLAKEMFLILDQPIQVVDGRKVVIQFCSVYYQQLAKEMFLILDQPIQVVGGERL